MLFRSELGETLNLFTYFEENPLNAEFFKPDAQGGTEYERVLSEFRNDKGGSAEIYFGDSRYELVYAPIPRTGWEFISCVSYDHITADAAQINQETIQLTMFIIVPVSYTHLDVYKRQVVNNGVKLDDIVK